MVRECIAIDPVPLRLLIANIPTAAHRVEIRRITKAMARELSPTASDAIEAALVQRQPELDPTIRHLKRGLSGESIQGDAGQVLALERDAVQVALSIAGLRNQSAFEWHGDTDGGFLSRIAYDTPEDLLVPHDASRFPGWEALPGGRPDWIDFSDGESHIRIGNVNHTKLEMVLGVDLIYRHIDADTTVLVQYKRMQKEANNEWYYRVDDQLRIELERMRKIDLRISDDASPSTWRLHPHGFLLKLVKQPKEFNPNADDLLPGMYLPLRYLDELLADDCTLTTRGARRLGYDTINRYLTNGLFVDLVRQGWIGTRGVTTNEIASLIEAAVGVGRSVLLAEESGEQSRSNRRRRPGGS